MEPELIIWLIISLLGLGGLPAVWRRRMREEMYVKVVGETRARDLLNESRRARLIALSFGLICGSAVPFSVWLLPAGDARQLLNITLLIVEYSALVLVIVLDEWYAARIERLR